MPKKMPNRIRKRAKRHIIPTSVTKPSAWVHRKKSGSCPDRSHIAPGWDNYRSSKNFCVRDCVDWEPQRARDAHGRCVRMNEGDLKAEIYSIADLQQVLSDLNHWLRKKKPGVFIAPHMQIQSRSQLITRIRAAAVKLGIARPKRLSRAY